MEGERIEREKREGDKSKRIDKGIVRKRAKEGEKIRVTEEIRREVGREKVKEKDKEGEEEIMVKKEGKYEVEKSKALEEDVGMNQGSR